MGQFKLLARGSFVKIKKKVLLVKYRCLKRMIIGTKSSTHKEEKGYVARRKLPETLLFKQLIAEDDHHH